MTSNLSDIEIGKLVGWAVHKIPHPDFITDEDLFQEGWIAALEAIKSFRSDKNTKLSSWIVTVVYGTLQCYVTNECKKNQLPCEFKKRCEENSFYLDLIQDRMDVSVLISSLRKILSPLAFEILAIQLKRFPERIERISLAKILRIDLLSIDNLYGELRWAITEVRRFL